MGDSSADVLRLALEVGGVGVLEWDLRTDRLRWSESFRALGMDPDHLPARGGELHRVIHPEDRAALDRAAGELRRGAATQPIDLRLWLADGSHRWVRGVSRTLHDAAGAPRTIVTAVTDVTDRRLGRDRRPSRDDALVQAALQLVGPAADGHGLEQLLAAVAAELRAEEAYLLGRAATDTGWETVASWPRQAELHHPPAALLDALDRGEPTTAASPDRAWLAAVSAADAAATGLALTRPGAAWSLPEAGRLELPLAAAHRARHHLRRDDEQARGAAPLQQLVEAAPAVLWEGTTDRMELDHVTPNVTRLTGFTTDEFARRWLDLVHPEDVGGVRSALRDAVREGRGGYVSRIADASGQWRHWHVALEVDGRRGEQGRRVRGASLDITALQRERDTVAAPAGRRATEPTEPDGATVLVVDDQPQILAVVDTALRSTGRHVLTAASAEEAAELVEQRGIDLLLTDLSLPGKDGRWLAGAVRARHPDCRVVLMSGYAAASELADADAALAKPFTLQQLRRCVDLALPDDR